MSRHRFVKGKIIEIVNGDLNYISESDIIDNGMFVNQRGGQNGIFYDDNKCNPIIDDFIIDGYWTDLQNNKITSALLGETVRFHIKTKNVPNNIVFLIRIYEWNRVNDIKLGSIKSTTINNNYGYIDFHLNKKAWKQLLKNIGEGLELELYCKIHGWGSSVDKGKYLKVKNIDKVIVFFIGGAADKESYYFNGPFNNIKEVQTFFESSLYNNPNAKKYYSSYYLDYSDAYDNVSDTIINNILDKSTPIYIIGHSLGGWNGAHLSKLLTEKNYKVKKLITLDPVGEGFFVYLGSSIYPTKPKPKADFWINVRANPSKPDQSDSVAEFGERWTSTSAANINDIVDVNHYNAKKMFTLKLSSGKSAYKYLLDDINTSINQ